MAGYIDLQVIVIMPKITVIKPADFQTLRHTEVKKSPATK
jgi:hypothetical protein